MPPVSLRDSRRSWGIYMAYLMIMGLRDTLELGLISILFCYFRRSNRCRVPCQTPEQLRSSRHTAPKALHLGLLILRRIGRHQRVQGWRPGHRRRRPSCRVVQGQGVPRPTFRRSPPTRRGVQSRPPHRRRDRLALLPVLLINLPGVPSARTASSGMYSPCKNNLAAVEIVISVSVA